MTPKHAPYDHFARNDEFDNDSLNATSLTPDPASLQSFFSSKPVTTASTTPTQTLYLTEAGDTASISVNDLFQGQLGDCFLISSIGELALKNPLLISNMIKTNSNGSETVTLYTATNGNLPNFSTTSFKPISVNVTNVFPTYSVDNGATQDVVGNVKEIWPQVLEKAFAMLNGGYNAIANGGYPVLAMEELTGHVAKAVTPSSLSLASLNTDIAAGDLITMDTSSQGAMSHGLVSGHAYMLEGVVGSGANAMIKLGNPWGYDQPSLIPFAQLSKSGIVEVDIGRVA